MLHDVRQFIDRLHIDGHTIGEDHDDDPVLIDPAGRAVDTWRENYPYGERLDRAVYDETKYLLQVELLKFQSWAARTGTKHVLLFEGRDAVRRHRSLPVCSPISVSPSMFRRSPIWGAPRSSSSW